MQPFRLLVFVLLAAICAEFVTAQSRITSEILPGNFSDEAFKHIEYLASMGHRQAGSANDVKTINYLTNEFSSLGLDVDVQPFQFESFEYSDAELTVNNTKLKLFALGLNPYKKNRFWGEAFIIDWSTFDKSKIGELTGRIIITNDWYAHFRLLTAMPEFIIYLDHLEFEKINSMDTASFNLNITPSTKQYESANVVAQIGNATFTQKEILITAHFDTYRRSNPGASDNASGVSVIIELAKYFKRFENELPCVIKFIAFGAEETGIVGSRNYLYNNYESLQNCELLFNLDDVGGHGKIIVEKNGGVANIPTKKGLAQIPDDIKSSTWEGVSSMWRMLPDSNNLLKIFTASNHPDWLVNTLERSINELGYEVTYTGMQGSDQLTFAQAGIVTSGVGIIGDYSHTPEDKPEHINKDGLKKAGEIAARVIIDTIKRITEN